MKCELINIGGKSLEFDIIGRKFRNKIEYRGSIGGLVLRKKRL